MEFGDHYNSGSEYWDRDHLELFIDAVESGGLEIEAGVSKGERRSNKFNPDILKPDEGYRPRESIGIHAYPDIGVEKRAVFDIPSPEIVIDQGRIEGFILQPFQIPGLKLQNNSGSVESRYEEIIKDIDGIHLGDSVYGSSRPVELELYVPDPELSGHEDIESMEMEKIASGIEERAEAVAEFISKFVEAELEHEARQLEEELKGQKSIGLDDVSRLLTHYENRQNVEAELRPDFDVDEVVLEVDFP